jgi:beta-lactamase regulating signal transducer with metallopeptidase domain
MAELKTDLMAILGIFISVAVGLGLTPTIIGYADDIVSATNASDIVILIAPFIPVVWIVGCMSLAGALAYGVYKSHK